MLFLLVDVTSVFLGTVAIITNPANHTNAVTAQCHCSLHSGKDYMIPLFNHISVVRWT